MCVIESNTDITLNKNVMLRLFCFSKVVQKQRFGEAGT